MNTLKHELKILTYWISSVVLLAWQQGAQAAPLVLADAPLFLGSTIEPNVFFELDDSGSMDWETLTFDYFYYRNYWIRSATDTNAEDVVLSGIWENSTDESTSSSSGSGGGTSGSGKKKGKGGGSGSSGGSTSTGSGVRKDIYYLYKESDRLYTGSTLTTPEDSVQTYSRDWRARSTDFNLLYYNPRTTYNPWTTSFSNATFSSARSNPQSGQTGYSSTRNLNGLSYAVWTDDHGYDGNAPDGPDDINDGANGEVDLWDTHTRYTFNVSSSRLDWVKYTIPAAATVRAKGVDCTIADAMATTPFTACYGTVVTSGSFAAAAINPFGRTFAEEQTNFANWYQYYRKRSFVAKGAIARVIQGQSNFRYGLSLINSYTSLFKEVPRGDASTFAASNASLLTSLFQYTWIGQGTPLRRGLERTGAYFDATLSGKTDPIISECQQNFSILLSDGFWNGSDPSFSPGDADGDGRSRTLADTAKYYYDKDLSGLPNNVPTSVIDGNNKQHMVTFTVAFGLRGVLEDTDNDGFPNPVLADNSPDWGNVYSSDSDTQTAARIDDLWHAAINSKGWYIQAQTPDAVVNALTDALSDITDRVGSSASVATNSGSLNAGSHLFQARFDSGGWSGQLLAYAINADATLNPVPSWEAGAKLDLLNFNTGRTILTTNSSTGGGIPFRFPADYRTPVAGTNLTSSQVTSLMVNAPYPVTTTVAAEITANQNYGSDLLNFVRGDRVNEETAPRNFRGRNSKLGDIVDSDPKYVGPPRFRYPKTLAFAPKLYSTYVTANASRTPMVYVGANDGMLHAFREDTGVEVMAFIPNTVIRNLPALANPLYQHSYFVNEAPTIVDAFLPTKTDPISGTAGAWRTVLVGGLGGGGQGVYALDVSDPTRFTEANANSLVLWEFDDTDDRDLGYTYSEVQVAKMANGVWAAIFSNGYNNTFADGNASTNGNAALFIVNLETGALIKKISTNAGSTTTPNGLATPSIIDTNGDGAADIIYAGDLQGKVWKFDVSSSTVADWDVDYKLLGIPLPIFTTRDSQPITSPIQLSYHPEGRPGYMLFFGSGKYIEPDDNSVYAQPTQAFYGIWDKDLSTLTPFTYSNLLQQNITDQITLEFDTDGDSVNDLSRTVRKNSNRAINYDTDMGWYIRLIPDKVNGVANTNNFGEKQVSRAIVRDGRVIFTSLLPSQGACDFGGLSFISILNYANGGQITFPAFDLNGDDTFDDADELVGGLQTDVGIVPTLSILTDDDRDIAFGSGSSGDVEVIELNVGNAGIGRQSWRELR